MSKPVIGGQAVMEGVMMKAPEGCAVAVRKPDGDIEVRMLDCPEEKKGGFKKLPFLRGIFNMWGQLKLGMKALSISADLAGEESGEPSKFEKFISDKTGRDINDVIMIVAGIMAIGLAIVLFTLLPALITLPLQPYLHGTILYNLIEGVVRMLIFLVYLFLASRLKDIKRTFRYHGAEHKVVHCYEHDQDLTVENVKKFPTQHPRCGTSFLFLVMLISVLVYSLAGPGGNAMMRILIRIVMLPIVVGVSYEVLRLAANWDNVFTRILKAPGLMLQNLTALEPDDSMLEVSIASFKAAAYGIMPEAPEESGFERQLRSMEEGSAF